MTESTRMKLSASLLPHLVVDYDVDQSKRSITATLTHFDSELLRMFFLSLERQGTPVIDDERGLDSGPQWSVFAICDGVRFRVRVVQLSYAKTVSLTPERDGDRLMPGELQQLKDLSVARGQELQARFGLKGLA